MPTGHTYPVVEGEITTLNEFAYECSRSFVWSFREGNALAYPPRHDGYYAEQLPKTMAELSAWDNMSEEEKYAEWSAMADDMTAQAARSRAKAEEAAARIQPLLNAALNVQVPETHKRFKEFMVEQLQSTLDQDGTHNPKWYSFPNYSEWCDARRPQLLNQISRYAVELAKSEENYQKSREWITILANLFNLEVNDAEG